MPDALLAVLGNIKDIYTIDNDTIIEYLTEPTSYISLKADEQLVSSDLMFFKSILDNYSHYIDQASAFIHQQLASPFSHSIVLDHPSLHFHLNREWFIRFATTNVESGVELGLLVNFKELEPISIELLDSAERL